MDKKKLFDDFDENIDIEEFDAEDVFSDDAVSVEDVDGADDDLGAEEIASADDVNSESDEVVADEFISPESDDVVVDDADSHFISEESDSDDEIKVFLEKRRAKMKADGDPVYTTANRVKKEPEEALAEPAKKLTVGRIILRITGCVGTTLGLILITLLIAIAIICCGPSNMVRDMFVTNMVQTGQMDFLAYIFLSEEEVDEIVNSNLTNVPEGETDTSLIQIGGKDDESGSDEGEKEFDINGLEILDITGRTFKGKLLIVNDPSRVTVGTPPAYGEDCVGQTTLYMAQQSNSIAAINGGGYVDVASNKTGGTPMGRDESGVVIAGGKLKYGNLNTTYEIIGLDKNGILHVDNMTAQEALDKGIRDAVNWGPILVKNGEPCVVQADGVNVGFHPRSAIGQREDGAILLLVIDGRQSHSLGASYDDLIEVMVNNGAVNAANLDGGMSSYMVYENKIITEPYLLYEPRNVSTSWLVSRVEGE